MSASGILSPGMAKPKLRRGAFDDSQPLKSWTKAASLPWRLPGRIKTSFGKCCCDTCRRLPLLFAHLLIIAIGNSADTLAVAIYSANFDYIALQGGELHHVRRAEQEPQRRWLDD